MYYEFTVEEPLEIGEATEYHYYVRLGDKLTKHKEPMQKRFVRHLAEQHYGHPVKNPTQRVYVGDSVFSVTQKTTDAKWHVVIRKNKTLGARNARLGKLGLYSNRRGKTIPKG